MIRLAFLCLICRVHCDNDDEEEQAYEFAQPDNA